MLKTIKRQTSLYLSLSLSVCLSLPVFVSLCLSLTTCLCLSQFVSLCVLVSLCLFLSIFVCLSLSVSLPVFVSLCLSLSASLSLSLCLSLSVSVSVSLSLSLSLSVSLSLSTCFFSLCLSLYLSLSLSVSLSTCLCLCLCVCVSLSVSLALRLPPCLLDKCKQRQCNLDSNTPNSDPGFNAHFDFFPPWRQRNKGCVVLSYNMSFVLGGPPASDYHPDREDDLDGRHFTAHSQSSRSSRLSCSVIWFSQCRCQYPVIVWHVL